MILNVILAITIIISRDLYAYEESGFLKKHLQHTEIYVRNFSKECKKCHQPTYLLKL